jgi:hypothetical protein
MRDRRSDAGQTLAELGIVMPILLLFAFGVLEVSWALFQSNVIRGYVREASNLISRNRSFQEAENAIASASTAGGPVRIGPGEADSRMILSVVTLGSGGSNNNRAIILQRHQIGNLNATSVLGTPPQSSYGSAPDYIANNPTNDTSIRLAGALPNGYVLGPGQSLYVTEIFTRRGSIVNFAVLPDTLYASAFF